MKRLDSALGHVRVALVVPKFGFTAVQRNKLKRRLRELTRLHLLQQSGSWDVLVRAKRDAYDATFERLRDEIGHVVTQLQ